MSQNYAPPSTRSRSSRRLALPLAAAVGVLGFAAVQTLSGGSAGAAAAVAPIGMFPHNLAPSIVADTDRVPVELGVKFTPQRPGALTAVQYYQSAQATGVNRATVWSATGKAIAQVTFPVTTQTGWRTIPLTAPVKLTAGQTYVASYFAPKGGYPTIENNLAAAKTVIGFRLPAGAGVYKYGPTGGFPTSTYKGTNYLVDVVYSPVTNPPATTSTSTSKPTSTSTTTVKPTTTSTTTVKPTTTSTSSPTATATPSATTTATKPPTQTGWPDASNTGVPAGTTLAPYTGPCTITTANTVIDAKQVNCELLVKASGVKITRSRLNGRVTSDSPGSVSISDTYIDGGPQEIHPAVGYQNVSLLRVNIVGGEHSVQCDLNCTIKDSYLHDQTQPATDRHVNAFISNGGSNFTLTHNTMVCTVHNSPQGGGCTAHASLFGDFGPISNATFDGNLFKSGSNISYCLYAGYEPNKAFPKPSNVTVRNNVFERGPNGKCGFYGAVTSYLPGNGGSFSSNTWDDGTPLNW